MADYHYDLAVIVTKLERLLDEISDMNRKITELERKVDSITKE